MNLVDGYPKETTKRLTVEDEIKLKSAAFVLTTLNRVMMDNSPNLNYQYPTTEQILKEKQALDELHSRIVELSQLKPKVDEPVTEETESINDTETVTTA